MGAIVSLGICDVPVACYSEDQGVVLCVPMGMQGDPGLVNLAMFTAFMEQYNAALGRYASEEEAALDGVVSGQEFVWSADTDVGIPGDKHIMGG